VAHPAPPNPTCAIPQPAPIVTFTIGFESCGDLDSHDGVFDVPSGDRPLTKIPLVGCDKRKADCDGQMVGPGSSGLSEAERIQQKEECDSYACDEEMRERVRKRYQRRIEA
jgi:hypothetical protein